MRPIRVALAFFILLLCSGSLYGQSPVVNACKDANGGTPKRNYTTTIASSGGSAGCTTNYSSSDAIFVGYNQATGSDDRTTLDITATGATITWHKAVSIQNGIFAPPGFWTGLFYACPGDITSPTSSIAISIDMGGSMAGITSMFTLEANLHGICTLDKTMTGSTCCSAAQYATGDSGTLSSSSEFVVAVTMSTSGSSITLAAGSGGACATTCLGLGTFTIPAHGQDNEAASAEAIEYVSVLTNTHGTVAFNQTTAGLAQNIVGATFQAGSSSTGQRGPKGKIL